MDLFEAIEKRHSYRDAFSPDPIPRETLARIVTAGMQAPSGCNKQTTEFLVVDDPELLQAIAAMPGLKPCSKTAPAIIFCLTNTHPEPAVYGLHFESQDCAAAVENILLAITALGYASVWIDGWLKAEGRAETIASLLHIPPAKTVQVMLPLGKPLAPPKSPPKKSLHERAWFNHYAPDAAS